MTDYKQLAIYYLKAGKHRTWITIIGVMLTAAILYAGLNTALNYYYDARDEARAEENYELYFYTTSQNQVKEISEDSEIASAYTGEMYHYGENKIYKNALFVNTKHPFRMKKTLERLCNTYGVEGDYNEGIAAFYLVDDDVSGVFIVIVLVIWISYIFAIFGVGIIRNSIQLISLEQIKDYGILRCIGATKKQLSSFIYIMGFLMEMTGVTAGVVLGYPISALICLLKKHRMSFHVLPIGFVMVVFLFDLYFVMKECCKFVNDMTPVSAVRGEFRIKKEKIKLRKSGLIGKLLGIEGDYAYKSLRRNPGRFWKSTVTIGVGIAAFIVVIGLMKASNRIYQGLDDVYGYYQVIDQDGWTSPGYDPEDNLYYKDINRIKKIEEYDCVTAVKQYYQAEVLAGDVDAYHEHLTDDLKNEIQYDLRNDHSMESFCVYGYDEDDLKRIESELIEGTTDLSENGVIVVRNMKIYDELENDSMLSQFQMKMIQGNTYQVGDTIEIVDEEKLRERVKEKREEDPNALGKYENSYLVNSYKELVEEGAFKSYTVEGIISGEHLQIYDITQYLITSVPNYLEMSCRRESQITGLKIRIDKDLADVRELTNIIIAISDDEYATFEDEEYLGMLIMIKQLNSEVRYAILFILFVVGITGFNIINTTASGIHLRKKEFAQLRVIGLSKKRLFYTVLLEGIVTTIGANLIGFIMGTAFFSFLMPTINLIYPVGVVIPWEGFFIGLIISAALLCGSIYFPLRGLPMDMASDLVTDGD